MRMRMMVVVLVRACFFGLRLVRMLVGMALVMAVPMVMSIFKNNMGVILYVFGSNDVNPGRADPTAVNALNLNMSINSECCYGLPKQLGINSGMQQSA